MKTGHHLPHVITQCYLPTDASDPTLTPVRGRYSIYLPHRDGRLSWPRWLFT